MDLLVLILVVKWILIRMLALQGGVPVEKVSSIHFLAFLLFKLIELFASSDIFSTRLLLDICNSFFLSYCCY